MAMGAATAPVTVPATAPATRPATAPATARAATGGSNGGSDGDSSKGQRRRDGFSDGCSDSCSAAVMASAATAATAVSAAAAAAIIGMGATWALGISSSAAQLQANKTSLPESIYNLTGVIPFTETIFLWQSIAMTIILVIVSIAIAYWSAPKGNNVKTIDSFNVQFEEEKPHEEKSTRPGDWLENSPIS